MNLQEHFRAEHTLLFHFSPSVFLFWWCFVDYLGRGSLAGSPCFGVPWIWVWIISLLLSVSCVTKCKMGVTLIPATRLVGATEPFWGSARQGGTGQSPGTGAVVALRAVFTGQSTLEQSHISFGLNSCQLPLTWLPGLPTLPILHTFVLKMWL